MKVTGLLASLALHAKYAFGNSSSSSSSSSSVPASKNRKDANTIVLNTDHNLSVESRMGQKVLQNARALEVNQDVDFSFVAKYSIKFQGCHHVHQWNEDARDEEDVRIYTKRLVRFRLCPTDTCSGDSWSGCGSDYGDYIVDLETFVNAYWEGMQENQNQQCEAMKDICGDNSNCYSQNGMEECIENNNQGDDNVAKAMANFDPIDYMECREYQFQNGNQVYDQYGEEIKFYIGPFCADQGGAINLGLFTDETCTAFYSGGSQYFQSMMGFDLPFSSDSLIPSSCVQCAESQNQNNNNGNDNNDNDNIAQVCEEVYEKAGKCESKMQYASYPNTSACSYISGIKIVKENGSILSTSIEASSAASICIGIFTTSATLLAAYVYYLKTSKYQIKFFRLMFLP